MKKVLLLLSVVSVLFLAGCVNNENVNNNANNNSGDAGQEINTNVESGNTENENVQSGEVEENAESGDVLETQSGEVEASFLTNEFLSKAEWVPVRAFDSVEEEEVPLNVAYGSAVLQYGVGSLKFTNDGNFFMHIGVTEGPESSEGTYVTLENGEVKLMYKNGDQQIINVTEINGKYVLSFYKAWSDIVVECEQQ